MKPLASVIIIVKNDPGVERTLTLLQEQSGIVPFETIVVDASAPDRLSSVRKKFPAVRWEQFDQHGKHFTIPGQRNRGVELAKADSIVFIDANCAPGAGWLAAMVHTIQDGEDIVFGPCRPSNPNNLVRYTEEHATRTYVEECTTMNVALLHTVFERVGKFDNSFSYGSDVDFFWRARDAGYKICYEPSAYVAHDYGGMEEQSRRAYRYGKARAQLHKKHWRKHLYHLVRYEPHVWTYPLFILSLPLAFFQPLYLAVLLIPIVKNRSVTVVVHHLIFAVGVIVGTVLTPSHL